MAEDNFSEFQSSQNNTVNSSQESDLLSQETFNILWKSISDSSLNAFALNFNELDSCNLSNETEKELVPNENSAHGGLQSPGNMAVSSIQLPTQISTIGSNVQSSALPACETWPGQYNFIVSFNHQHKSTKGVAWTYSRLKDKLYVGKDAPCPINFSVNTVLSQEAYIRVMALYTSPEQVTEIVHRCVNHSMDEINNGRVEAQHLIRCESTTATYHTDTAGRHSVLVPFENPPAGQQYSTYIYKFACFGSCAGGPNRRPLMLVFTLESGNRVIGRRKLDVKICACPGRDKKSDEDQCLPAEKTTSLKRKPSSECVSLSEVMDFTKSVYVPLPKKNKVNPNKDGLYILSTEDKECYDFLQHMKKFFEICKTVKGLPPNVVSFALQQHMQKVKSEKKD